MHARTILKNHTICDDWTSLHWMNLDIVCHILLSLLCNFQLNSTSHIKSLWLNMSIVILHNHIYIILVLNFVDHNSNSSFLEPLLFNSTRCSLCWLSEFSHSNVSRSRSQRSKGTFILTRRTMSDLLTKVDWRRQGDVPLL
jgi:hypothetical protein